MGRMRNPGAKMLPPEGFIDATALIHCGIYMLVWREEIVYIGQSTKLSARVNTHCYSRWKHRQQKLAGRVVRGVVFDQVWIRACALDDLNALEKELIRKYMPRYNKKDKPLPEAIALLVAQLTPQAAQHREPTIRRRL